MTKHRTHSAEFKWQVVQEYLSGETLHGLAKRHDISRNLIRVWIEKYQAGALPCPPSSAPQPASLAEGGRLMEPGRSTLDDAPAVACDDTALVEAMSRLCEDSSPPDGAVFERLFDSKAWWSTTRTLAALAGAVASPKPSAGCVHHSDRGSQYAAMAYRDELAARGLEGSMKQRGNPYDNAKAESFMKTVKVEAVYPMAFETAADVAEYPPCFIEDIYDGKRLHSALNYLSPNQFEDQFTRQTVKSAA